MITIIFITTFFTSNVSAMTLEDIRQKMIDLGPANVTGNLFVWIICAVAFLKVSQKMESLLGSIGINVGNTGGSMLGEFMIAFKTLQLITTKGLRGGKGGEFMPGNRSGGIGQNPPGNNGSNPPNQNP